MSRLFRHPTTAGRTDTGPPARPVRLAVIGSVLVGLAMAGMVATVTPAAAGVLPVVVDAPTVPVVAAPMTRLQLMVAEGESAGPIARMSVLRCHPAGGTHPTASEVCAALRLVDGEPRMTGTPVALACPMIFDPVTVSVVGTLDGQRVDHRRTYPNPCVLLVDTGALFEF